MCAIFAYGLNGR